ncbi:ribonuclease T [Maritimibacter sp. 55A14]|uniref:ribonuclease T2 family protein n=1 Tax=Maritimibacter sp. 55A14 TaxID=2174844 RepID=UPI000D6065E6|nr:ribonuclease T2 [Maritimibacter sp. 55A14]PWE32320.1 ribonuclease T [Maritimibacter sp. 55A14]
MRALMLFLLLAAPARAEGERPGIFDYYVMALSWTPAWCATEGDARGADQCDARHDHGFTLHGLWPQFETGWPSFCRGTARSPSHEQTAAMADIMGSGGLAWHQWKKHGRCTGLTAEAYFDLSRRAYGRIARPDIFRRLERPIRLPAHVVEEAFLEANPGLAPDMVTVTCRSGRIAEVRICLTRDLEPRPCGRAARRDCRQGDVMMEVVR